MPKLTLQTTIKNLQKKEYVKAMKETDYGWKPSKNYPDVGCPSDLQFIRMADEPHQGRCFMDCKDCWEYVLKNKWR